MRRLSPRAQFYVFIIVMAILTGLGVITIGPALSAIIVIQVMMFAAIKYWFKKLKEVLVESQKVSMENQKKIWKRLQNLEEKK